MTICIFELDSSPRGIIKRLERKNRKSDLTAAVQQIRAIGFDDRLNDAEKLKLIHEKILDRLI